VKRDEDGRKWAQPFHLKLDRQVGSKLGSKLRHGDVARLEGRLFRVDDVLDHDDQDKRLLLGHWDDSTVDTDSYSVEADRLYEVR
jgi:hypothetical protein